MNPKKTILILTLAALTTIALGSFIVSADEGGIPHRETLGSVYVSSQGKYYDTFVTVESLIYNDHNGNSFQRLYGGVTEFGPGDPGHRGGRWWVDLNNDYVMDPEGIDHYVLCPLLGPGISGAPPA